MGRLDNHLLLANSRRRSSAPGYAVPSETTPDPAFLLHTTEAGATLAGSGLSERRVLPDEVCLLSGDASATRLSKTIRTMVLAIHVRVTRTTTTVVQKAKVSGLTFFSGEGARDPDKPYARGPPAEGRQVEVTGSELPDPAARRPAETSPTRAGAQHDARITRQVDGAQRQCPRNADGSHACCKCLQAQKG